MDDFIAAIALVLVFEGIMPFISPHGWRSAMEQAGRLPDKTLRIIGFCSMLAGVLILFMSR